MSTLWGLGMMLGMFSAWSFAKFIVRKGVDLGDKRNLITAIVSFALAISFIGGGMIFIENCNGCGYEYFKPDMPDYCVKCGHALAEDAAKKFECGCGAVYYSDGGEKFCTECGSEIVYEMDRRTGNGTS